MKGLQSENRWPKKKNQLKAAQNAFSIQETAQNGSKLLQIMSGSGELFKESFLAGLGGKEFKRFQTGSSLPKKTAETI